MTDTPLVRRVLERLWRAEVSEPNPHFQADYRISWITVLLADRGLAQPNVIATYGVLGCHPDRVWGHLQWQRQALLGREYSQFYDEAGNWKTEPLADPWQGQ